MFSISERVRSLKTITSSILPKSSGDIKLLSSESMAFFLASPFDLLFEKPTVLVSASFFTPIFEVIIIRTLEKETVLPAESVRQPSSSICKSRL